MQHRGVNCGCNFANDFENEWNAYLGGKAHFVTQGSQLILRLHAPLSAKMRARRIFDFGEKCALVAAPNLDQVAAWPPE